MRLIIPVLAIIATAVSGCATVDKQALTSETAAELKSETVTYTSRAKPSFSAMTAERQASQ